MIQTGFDSCRNINKEAIMKKVLSILTTLILLTTSITALAIDVEFWHAGGGVTGEAVDQAIESFNETVGAEKGITVTGVYQGSYDETLAKTMNAIAAGNQPALVMLECTTGGPTMASNGALVYLDKYFEESGLKIDDFVEILTRHSFDQDNNMIALPYMRSNAVYYYNKTLFDELSLDVPVTISDLEDAGRKIHEAHPDVYGFEMYCMSGGQWILINMLAQLGSNCFAEDGLSCPALEDGTMLTVLEAWKSWVDEGWCSIPSITNTGTVLRENFAQGRVASMPYSCGSMAGILKSVAESENPFEVGVAYMPTFGVENPPIGGNNVGIVGPGNSEEIIEAAWEFLLFLNSPEQAAKTSKQTGYVPATFAATETEIIQEFWEEFPTFRTAFEQLLNATIVTNYSDYATDFMEVLNIGTSLLIQDGSLSPEEALQLMKDEAVLIFP